MKTLKTFAFIDFFGPVENTTLTYYNLTVNVLAANFSSLLLGAEQVVYIDLIFTKKQLLLRETNFNESTEAEPKL